MYFIKEAAKKLDVSIYTLRYYDKEGLTPFVKRNNQGIRVYTDTDIEWIYMIRVLRDVDMPISMIKEYVNLYMIGKETIPERREIISIYKEFLNKKLELINRTMKIVDKKLEYYDKALEKDISLNCSDYEEKFEDFKERL